MSISPPAPLRRHGLEATDSGVAPTVERLSSAPVVRDSGGKPAGTPVDALTGFVSDAGPAIGRPVGVAVDKRGAFSVADDEGNVVWRVTSSTSVSTAR